MENENEVIEKETVEDNFKPITIPKSFFSRVIKSAGLRSSYMGAKKLEELTYLHIEDLLKRAKNSVEKRKKKVVQAEDFLIPNE